MRSIEEKGKYCRKSTNLFSLLILFCWFTVWQTPNTHTQATAKDIACSEHVILSNILLIHTRQISGITFSGAGPGTNYPAEL